MYTHDIYNLDGELETQVTTHSNTSQAIVNAIAEIGLNPLLYTWKIINHTGKITIGDKVKRLYVDRKGKKHLSLQTGIVVSLTGYYGHPAAIVNFDEVERPGLWTLRSCTTTEPTEDLEVISK